MHRRAPLYALRVADAISLGIPVGRVLVSAIGGVSIPRFAG